MIKCVEESRMRRPVKSALLAAAILVTGCLATACAQAASGAAIRDSPTATAQPSVTPPTPTLTPTTVAPSTVFTTITPTPTAPTTPATSTPASSGGSGTDLIWLWVILGALALLGIILWATRRPSRAPAPAPIPGPARSSATGWHARAADAYAQGAALDGAVRAAAREGAFIEPAGERWYEIRSLADDLAERLYAMRETAPNAERHAEVEHALRSLDAVRFAVDAEPTITPEDEGAAQDANLHSSLLALESALNRLRTPESRYQ
jgi:hypothetical protein